MDPHTGTQVLKTIPPHHPQTTFPPAKKTPMGIYPLTPPPHMRSQHPSPAVNANGEVGLNDDINDRITLTSLTHDLPPSHRGRDIGHKRQRWTLTRLT